MLLHGLLAGNGKQAFALSLLSLLLAPTANSQEAARIPFAPGAAPPRLFGGATGTAMMSLSGRPPLGGVGPGPLARDIEAEPGTRRTLAYSFRQSQRDTLVPVREPLEILQTRARLLAAFGLRAWSFRVWSWRRLGPGPSVHAGTFSFIRSAGIPAPNVDAGLGLAVTVYRLGSRFEPAYRLRPLSIRILVRLRFGS